MLLTDSCWDDGLGKFYASVKREITKNLTSETLTTSVSAHHLRARCLYLTVECRISSAETCFGIRHHWNIVCHRSTKFSSIECLISVAPYLWPAINSFCTFSHAHGCDYRRSLKMPISMDMFGSVETVPDSMFDYRYGLTTAKIWSMCAQCFTWRGTIVTATSYYSHFSKLSSTTIITIHRDHSKKN